MDGVTLFFPSSPPPVLLLPTPTLPAPPPLFKEEKKSFGAFYFSSSVELLFPARDDWEEGGGVPRILAFIIAMVSAVGFDMI